ncbi:MAG: hypothetical protein NTW86_14835, partial [Candidatus Sumerlaeota bacterium]|nr:hypothetical protein [Candidatus Sumerlaeota bacterium]
MSDTVFILGAGASKAAGVPLMAEFLDVAQDLYAKGLVKDEGEHFKRVFEAIGELQGVHSKSLLDINNVESVFAAFETAQILGKLVGDLSGQRIQEMVDSLKRVIAVTIHESLIFPLSSRQDRLLPPFPYQEFGELIKKLRTKAAPPRTVSIITFNYDLSSDFALHFHGLPFDYSLDDGESVTKLPVKIPLLKLHGSLNWFRSEESDTVVVWPVEKVFEYTIHLGEVHPSPKHADIMSRFCNFRKQASIDPDPVIVPPTWNKTGYHQHLASVWRRAAKELTDAQNVFIIGYSLQDTDLFFHYLFALGLAGKMPLRRLWVI